MLKLITIFLLKWRIYKAEIKIKKEDCQPVVYAYTNLIKTYKTSIMYLKSESLGSRFSIINLLNIKKYV